MYVEIPHAFVKLYNIKNNSKARCKVREFNNVLIIVVETKASELS